MNDLRGKRVVVTGGAMGIGKTLARLLLKVGAKIVLVDILDKELKLAKNELDSFGEVNIFNCDVSNLEVVNKLACTVEKECGSVDILINNAGVINNTPFIDKTPEIIQRTININFLAVCWMIKAFLPGMINKGEGCIVNIASAGGLFATPYNSDYCASKAAVIALTDALRQEMKLEGNKKIKFICVCPGITNTRMSNGTKQIRGVNTLKAEQVASKVINGIIKDEPLVIIPSISRSLLFWKSFIPPNTWDSIVANAGLSMCMRNAKSTIGSQGNV